MRLAQQIFAAYNEIDRFLTKEFDNALNSGNAARQATIRDFQRFNDNAYFVLLWGQLENEINQKFKTLVAAGQAHHDWKERRKFYNINMDRTKFEDRLAFLVNRNAGSGSAWAMAIRYYDQRNKIAHGESDRSGISVTTVIGDLYQVQSALTA
jgi:hypothetical protein